MGRNFGLNALLGRRLPGAPARQVTGHLGIEEGDELGCHVVETVWDAEADNLGLAQVPLEP